MLQSRMHTLLFEPERSAASELPASTADYIRDCGEDGCRRDIMLLLTQRENIKVRFLSNGRTFKTLLHYHCHIFPTIL